MLLIQSSLRNRPLVLGAACWMVAAAGAGVQAVRSGFFVSHNDFWGNYWLAQQLDWRIPESLYNGFFPLGYAAFLDLFSVGHPIHFAYAANVVFGLLLLACFGLGVGRLMGPWHGFFGMLIVSLNPLFFRYAQLPGTDSGCVALSTAGFLAILVREDTDTDSRASRRMAVLGGALLGLAALWRYHILVLVVCICLASAIAYRNHVRRSVLVMAGFLAVYSIQMTVCLLSDRGPFETMQAFNVYKFVYGVDWHAVPTEVPPALQTILGAPGAFLRNYATFMSGSLLLLLVPIIVLMAPGEKFRRLATCTAMSIVPYLLIVGAGGSERGKLIAVPSLVICLLVLSDRLPASLRPGQRGVGRAIAFAYTVTTLVTFGTWINRDRIVAATARARGQTLSDIQNFLTKTENIEDASRIYTDSHIFYLPDVAPFRPWYDGGWLRIDGYQYQKLRPRLKRQDMNSFLADCRTQGITHLVVKRWCGSLPTEFQQSCNWKRPFAGVEAVAQLGMWGLFRIE